MKLLSNQKRCCVLLSQENLLVLIGNILCDDLFQTHSFKNVFLICGPIAYSCFYMESDCDQRQKNRIELRLCLILSGKTEL